MSLLKNFSAGCLVAPTYTDNGSGNVTINAARVALFDNANFDGILKTYLLAAITETLTDGVLNYVVGDYNSGTPIMRVTTDVSVINESNVIPIFTIARTGNYLHTVNWDALGIGMASKLHYAQLKYQRYRREYGVALSQAATRLITVSAGKVWIGSNGVAVDAYNSSTDTLFFFYHSSGNWTYSTAGTQYNNTQYDNGTDLATLTANRYAVNWIYRGVENQKHVYIVLGSGDYTAAQAEASQPPTLPDIVSGHAMLIGRIIVQKSSDTPYAVQSAFDTLFTPVGSSFTDPMTTRGDIIIRDATNTTARLPIGSSGKVLTSDGTDISYKVIPRVVQLKIFDDATALATGDGKLVFCIPEELNGYNLTKANAMVSTVSSSGAPTIQIRNVTDSVDMLSTRITIDANEFTSYTAATQPVIDTTKDDVATGDRIAIDVDGAGTGAKGLTILLTFGL